MRSAVLSGCCAALLVLVATGCTSTNHRTAPPTTFKSPTIGGAPPTPAALRVRYEQAVKRNPRDKYAWYNLGVIAQYTCDHTTAATDLLKALDIDPRFEAALYLYGITRYNASDWDAADVYLRKAVNANPLDANAHWLLGLALAHRQGVRPEDRTATRQLNEAIPLNPSLKQPRATSQLLHTVSSKCPK